MTTEQKKITVNDFKMWLSGVEEMQETGWTPTPTQWARIRQKIDDIEEVSVAAAVPTYNNVVSHAPTQINSHPYPMEDYNLTPPSSLEIPNMPINPGSLSPIFSTGAAQMTKTPDIQGGVYDPSHLV